MNAKLAVVIAGVMTLLAVAPVSAHPSFAAPYFEDQRATIQGTLVEFVYRSPHSFVTVDVTGCVVVVSFLVVEVVLVTYFCQILSSSE